jgi:hypothetical protein
LFGSTRGSAAPVVEDGIDEVLQAVRLGQVRTLEVEKLN